MMDNETLCEALNAEFKRLGASGEAGGLASWIGGDHVIAGDESCNYVVTAEHLNRLQQLQNEAGYLAALDVFPDVQ